MGKWDVSLPITVAPHRTKNFSRSVISCYELQDTTEEEIVDGLSSSGVTEAKRILTRRRGDTFPTNTIILTFDRTELPSEVIVGKAVYQSEGETIHTQLDAVLQMPKVRAHKDTLPQPTGVRKVCVHGPPRR